MQYCVQVAASLYPLCKNIESHHFPCS